MAHIHIPVTTCYDAITRCKYFPNWREHRITIPVAIFPGCLPFFVVDTRKRRPYPLIWDEQQQMVLALLAVLAAGQPQRFNKAKLLEVRKGQPLILHALAAAREACPDNVSFLCTPCAP